MTGRGIRKWDFKRLDVSEIQRGGRCRPLFAKGLLDYTGGAISRHYAREGNRESLRGGELLTISVVRAHMVVGNRFGAIQRNFEQNPGDGRFTNSVADIGFAAGGNRISGSLLRRPSSIDREIKHIPFLWRDKEIKSGHGKFKESATVGRKVSVRSRSSGAGLFGILERRGGKDDIDI